MEEDNHLPTPATSSSAAATDHSDPSLQRKHAAMIERLSNLHQNRSTRKPDPESNSTTSFLSRFFQSKSSIESTLTRIRQTPEPQSDPTLKPELDNVSISITNLEKLVAENSFSLPSYEVRTCLKTVADLKQFVEQVTCEVIPRKKFAFKKISAKKIPVQKDVAYENRMDTESQGSGFRILENSPGFRDKKNEDLVKEFNRGNDGEIREFVLSDLRHCDVRLMGCVSALFVNKLIDCKVYVGPVFGSVLIEEVENCVFVMASHQIRIHQAKGCDFYLQVRSRPIIEDSNSVRFAPYCLKYDGIEKDLEEANLGEETGNWSNVDDFKWLRAVQSPNWSILPENERLGTVDISN
ncbi:Tubulin-folding cofactor C [Capsicum annuum]|nr:Tubulin-folding cofactor C [Capsicum annuum]KAF3638378.1 Tubulin-folding cofactor C [Capsicum annuum]